MVAIPLIGPAGEPIDLIATLNSHGVTSLPPSRANGDIATRLETTVRLADGSARTIAIAAGAPGFAQIEMLSSLPTDPDEIVGIVRHLMRLEQDLSGFYAQACDDPMLAWVRTGYARMMRCQTVFEDVIKTVLTTNCTWSATVRMTERLVSELGTIDSGYTVEAPYGRAFPTPAVMAERDEVFYREVIRAGYRAPHLIKLARAVVDGELDLEAMGRATREELSDTDLEKQLLALPGVGPYAAAHIMHMLGRSSRLVLDSWTRPTYARLLGVDSVTDAEIRERFAVYEEQAGLAWWMVVTKRWFAQDETA